ncbi:hypothetical protein N7468_003346 [Penicillium chermesinum]|uniref:Uncharacterized protein n=1 Tax=Penicillium chermesinum TaxID=63820 RepID=A0A9W9P6H7_9EURO|nr:uncharacterized protein N7468_003346 [Penicillium chermesinum]KAJ5238727.1 hypothetical protein N7468_003346 [Penicillium chermesinum]
MAHGGTRHRPTLFCPAKTPGGRRRGHVSSSSGFFLTAGGSSSSEDHLDIFNSSECAALRLAVPDPGRNFLATVACPGKRTILNF